MSVNPRVSCFDASLVWSVLEHHMAGERRLDGVIGRLQVADSAQDDIGIVAEDAPQAMRESQADLAVDPMQLIP